MSDAAAPPEAGAKAPEHSAPKPLPNQNPAFRMIGMPNFRFKLPSRNLLIFLSITGSFAAAIAYDRRQKNAAQKKWCDLVSHVSQQPLPVNQMPRKLTIFLSAPPGDGIRPSREYFKEYIKPVLVAAAMDYDVIEGRKEGDVRYGAAEQLRRLRRKKGERGETQNQEMDPEQIVEKVREQLRIYPEPVVKGDLVIGRHTWKEYLRGLHEGWLGPLDEPEAPAETEPAHPSDDGSPPASPDPPSEPPAKDKEPAKEDEGETGEGKQPAEQEERPKKNPSSPSRAYLSVSSYSSSPASPLLPTHLEPSAPIPHTHILGFLNTPIRIYRFLTQRYLADSIGRETAAIVLGLNRPYHQSSTFASETTGELDASPVASRSPKKDNMTKTEAASAAPTATVQTSQNWEQQSLLAPEEAHWHKSTKKPRNDDLERVWLDEVVMDPRIAERMRRFELAPDEEERARRIGEGTESSRAMEVRDWRADPVLVEKHPD